MWCRSRLPRIVFLAACVLAVRTAQSAESECNKIVAENAYQAILKVTDVKPGDSIASADFELIEKNLIVLGSIKGKEGIKRLVRLVDYYLGEGTGEIYSQIIVERKADSLPLLQVETKSKSACDPKTHNCRPGKPGHLKKLIDTAKNGTIYGTGEPIAYLNATQLEKECATLKDAKGKR
jgi:hypothetical protein